MAYIVPFEIPSTCSECAFHSEYKDFYVSDVGMYKKISHCMFANCLEIDDPYRDIVWMIYNKEDWCPLKNIGDSDNG